MSYCLFLDDERNLSDVSWVILPSKITNDWKIVRNFDQFVTCIASYGLPKFVTFDHDLAEEHYQVMLKEVEAYRYTSFRPDSEGGLNLTFDYGKERTGYDCCKWLVDYCESNNLKFPDFAVHSMNPVGRERIEKYIENAKQHLDI